MKYPRYLVALRGLGRNNDEIAARLGCSKSMLYYYLRGDILPPVEKIKRIPELDEALTLDFQAINQGDLVQIPA
jgi:transcriptional regulator with XRE-family HTH domain